MSPYTGAVPDTRRPTNWRDDAACRKYDPELFFPDGSTGHWALQIEEAKAVCNFRCPVVERCLQWALESGQDSGVWGGLSEDERRAMKRRGGRPALRGPERDPGLVFSRTASLADACRELYDRYTNLVDGGYLVWISSKEGVRIQGRDRTYMQIGFQAGHGRWPDGKVSRHCAVDQCIAPECLTDNPMRYARKKAAKRDAEALAGVAV